MRALHGSRLPSEWVQVETPESETTLVLRSGAHVQGRLLLPPGGAIGEDLDYLDLALQVEPAWPQAEVATLETELRADNSHQIGNAVAFDGTTVRCARVAIDDPAKSFDAGRSLAESLPHEDLVHVVVFSEGLNVNGSDLVQGLASALPPSVTVTGGLSGDGHRFARTYVVWKGKPEQGSIVAAGFYGSALRIGYASLGGWDPFGPERLITKSRDNVLYELEHKSALALYKKYLGEHADGLAVRPGHGAGGHDRHLDREAGDLA